METCLVALTLSGVERLRLAFQAATSTAEQQNLLKAAADLMDRTLPMPEITAELKAASGNPVPALIKNRARLAAVPPALWNKGRVAPVDLGETYACGFMALDLALRRDKGSAIRTGQKGRVRLRETDPGIDGRQRPRCRTGEVRCCRDTP